MDLTKLIENSRGSGANEASVERIGDNLPSLNNCRDDLIDLDNISTGSDTRSQREEFQLAAKLDEAREREQVVERFRSWDRPTMIAKLQEIKVKPNLRNKLGDLVIPDRSSMHRMSDDELSQLCEDCNYKLNSTNVIGTLIDDGVKFGTMGYEALLVKSGIEAKGVSEALMKDPEFMGAIEQLVWLYGAYHNWPPHWRLMISITKTTSLTIASNKALSSLKEVNVNASEELLDRFKGL